MNTTKIIDNAGIPSFMVRVPKFKVSDVIPGGRDETHPAFIVNGKEVPAVYISKYQNVVIDRKAYSLPYQRPRVDIDFDHARAACEAKGAGWHLMTNAEWAAIALWAKAHGTLPHGNNKWGEDYRNAEEKGIRFDSGKILTGSGPASFAHDGTEDGIFDLNGNVWEWVAGLRLMDGEVQVIPDNNAAVPADQSSSSPAWTPVRVGTETVKLAEADDAFEYTTERPEATWGGCEFSTLRSSIEIPDVMKELALYPADDAPLTDYFWADLSGESLPIRGGGWYNGSSAGVFYLALAGPRSDAGASVGFRSAFVEI